MSDKRKQKNKWYQRRAFHVVVAMCFATLLYQRLTPHKEKAENKLDIGGPRVEINQRNSPQKTALPPETSPAQPFDTVEEISVTDSNVTHAYRNSDWQVIPTKQSPPHVISYDEGSKDRLEMRQALSQATAIPDQEIEEWWIGAAGDDQVTGTVSNITSGKAYRVTLQWQQNQGWQPTLVEELRTLPRVFD